MNYYQILKVEKDATPEQIRDSYISLIKKYHPDIYKGNKEYAEKITKELNDAYDILSVPEKRAEYDLMLFPPTTLETNYDTFDMNSSSPYQDYTYYNNNYQTTNNSSIKNEKQKETWIQKFKNKLYIFVDEHTKNLNAKSKISLVLLVIFLALLFTLISINDYLKFVKP